MARTSSSEVLLVLDRGRRRGLRVQIEEQLRDAVRSGRIGPGTALPSSRTLAGDLGITRGVVVAAYEQLVSEGYLVSASGSGTSVNPRPIAPAPNESEALVRDTTTVDFTPGSPDVSLFPRTAWVRATRSAMAVAAVRRGRRVPRDADFDAWRAAGATWWMAGFD